MLGLTCQHLGTLLVHGALGPGAGNIGVTPVLGWTVAPGPVVTTLTQSIGPALGQAAGQHTVPVDTLVCQRTLQVTLAPRLYTCGVGVSLQGLGTHAHCSVVVDPADGPVPALLQLTWVPTLLTDTCEVQRTFGV